MLQLLEKEIKAAMLAKNTDRLRALRALKTAIVTQTDGKEINEPDALKLVHKQISQRKDSISIYITQDRPDLAEIEKSEVKVLEEFLPEQMPIYEVTKVLERIIQETGAVSIKDMGKVMGLATKELSGKIDNKTIGEIIKGILS